MKVRLKKSSNLDDAKISNDVLKTSSNMSLGKNGAKISLKERVKNYKGPNLCKDFEWDEPRGKEMW